MRKEKGYMAFLFAFLQIKTSISSCISDVKSAGCVQLTTTVPQSTCVIVEEPVALQWWTASVFWSRQFCTLTWFWSPNLSAILKSQGTQRKALFNPWVWSEHSFDAQHKFSTISAQSLFLDPLVIRTFSLSCAWHWCARLLSKSDYTRSAFWLQLTTQHCLLIWGLNTEAGRAQGSYRGYLEALHRSIFCLCFCCHRPITVSPRWFKHSALVELLLWCRGLG